MPGNREDSARALDGPQGIGGWLILPAIGLCVFPISCVISILDDYVPIFQSGTWAAVTTPGAPGYHALWAPLLIGEIAFNLVFLALDLWLLVLLFSKSWRFPKVFVAFAALIVLFIVLDAVVAGSIASSTGTTGANRMAGAIVRALVVAAIWVPYMLVSKRVKNTFVKPAGAWPPAVKVN